jgi:hypothetical protein
MSILVAGKQSRGWGFSETGGFTQTVRLELLSTGFPGFRKLFSIHPWTQTLYGEINRRNQMAPTTLLSPFRPIPNNGLTPCALQSISITLDVRHRISLPASTQEFRQWDV